MSEIQYDQERMGLLFSDIQKYFNDLETMDIRSVEDLNDRRNFYAWSMILFSLLNRVFDLYRISGNKVFPVRKVWKPERKHALPSNNATRLSFSFPSSKIP